MNHVENVQKALNKCIQEKLGNFCDLKLEWCNAAEKRNQGHLSTSGLMSALKKSGTVLTAEVRQDWADALKKSLMPLGVEGVEIAGPGFVNLTLSQEVLQAVIPLVLNQAECYGTKETTGEKILIEFVSANPTGPLHVGHARQAALGDTLANMMQSQGVSVHREFFYNDAGVQIHTLAHSTQLRAKGFSPTDPEWPSEDDGAPVKGPSYRGEYLIEVANAFLRKESVMAKDASAIASGDVESLTDIKTFAVAFLRNEQDEDLTRFGVKFDQYTLESSFYASGEVKEVVQTLIERGVTEEKDGALWLKSTEYGDDKDRVMKKSDGTYTYFVPDLAYHKNKWQRGYAKALNIQGSDHHGTMARVRAGLQALEQGIAQSFPEYLFHTMVKVKKDGKIVKNSKRAGDYVALRDLMDWTSVDAARFMLLSRKANTEFTFDVDVAVKKTYDNPVYYVQYAHARIKSVMRLSKERFGDNEGSLNGVDLISLTHPKACDLLRHVARYPEVLAQATKDRAPHDLTFFVRDLATDLHSYYTVEQVLVPEKEKRMARLALLKAVAQVLKNALAILGVSAPEEMKGNENE